MQKRFAQKIEEMRGLIEDLRSASSVIASERSAGAVISSERSAGAVISSERSAGAVISSERSESRNLFLLAVSGGMDSMCMADLYLRCFGAESFAIAHCNFHLRGEESDGDEALVTKWAGENGIRMHCVDFDTAGYASDNGLSIEMAARELRYRWFGELCREHGYDAVVVAHHADDNAETLLLNMVRGAGLKGLTGMKPVAPLPAPESIPLLRPMLTFTRKQIEGHMFAFKVPYREDSTNASVEYRRNSIRHEVFPLLERMNPSYVRTLNREMTYLSDASSIVEEWCMEHVPQVMVPLSFRASEASREISLSRLMAIPQWRYLLYYILEPYGFSSSVLESLENLLVSDRTIPGKRFESADYILRTERQSLVIDRKMAGQTGDSFLPVRTPGTYLCNGRRFLVEVLPWQPGMPLKQHSGTIILDSARLKFPFVCRGWRQGDWMIPLGMRGRKKLSDLFNDLKYGQMEKDSALVIVDCSEDMAQRQHVAGLLGVRIDDRYKVSAGTENIIKITLLS